jgi:hypothetical protein
LGVRFADRLARWLKSQTAASRSAERGVLDVLVQRDAVAAFVF